MMENVSVALEVPLSVDGLLMHLGKASTLLTGHRITGQSLGPEPAQEKWFKSSHPEI